MAAPIKFVANLNLKLALFPFLHQLGAFQNPHLHHNQGGNFILPADFDKS